MKPILMLASIAMALALAVSRADAQGSDAGPGNPTVLQAIQNLQKSVNTLQSSVNNLKSPDTTVLITQASVLAAGGFPYHITQPGSYLLGSNLIVPDADTTAIIVEADAVTIDLSGFAILGPVICNGTLPTLCSPAGNGVGVLSPNVRNTTVRNGTIEGMGAYAVSLALGGGLVEQVHAHSNGQGGIGAHGVISRNVAIFNGGFGIDVSNGVASNNVVLGFTGTTGLFGNSALVTGNYIITLTGIGPSTGLDLGSGTGYSNNVIESVAPVVGSGVSLGGNLCGGATC